MKLSPREAKNDLGICKLNRDNFGTKNFWILTDSYNVSIHQQRNGESSLSEITIPRKEFNRLVDWYLRPQKVKKLR